MRIRPISKHTDGLEDLSDTSSSRRDLLKGLVGTLLFMVGQRTTEVLAATNDKTAMTDVWRAAVHGFIPLAPGLQPEVLNDIADNIIDDLAHHDPETLKSVTGIFAATLEDQATGEHWATDMLLQLQQTGAFSSFWLVAIRHIFRNPSVWDIIGYEGSSIEYGGYLERGFNDISWLQ
jgi:hypothetical protein